MNINIDKYKYAMDSIKMKEFTVEELENILIKNDAAANTQQLRRHPYDTAYFL